MSEQEQANIVSDVRKLFANRKSDYTIAAQTLADCVQRDAKTVRAHLRKAHKRASEMKNATWAIDKETAIAVAEHFSKAKRVSESESS